MSARAEAGRQTWWTRTPFLSLQSQIARIIIVIVRPSSIPLLLHRQERRQFSRQLIMRGRQLWLIYVKGKRNNTCHVQRRKSMKQWRLFIWPRHGVPPALARCTSITNLTILIHRSIHLVIYPSSSHHPSVHPRKNISKRESSCKAYSFAFVVLSFLHAHFDHRHHEQIPPRNSCGI